MSIAPINDYAPSPYEPGSSDFIQAQADMEKLSQLKVTKSDYKDADATHGWFGIFDTLSNKSDKQHLIGQQTQLEENISKHLHNIAAASEYGQVSPALLAQVQAIGRQLDSRLWQDENNAFGGAAIGSSLSSAAYDRASDAYHLQDALAFANTPDVIALSNTSTIIGQVNALDSKIRSDVDAYHFGMTQDACDAAKAQLVGPDYTQVLDLYSKINQQIGFGSLKGGISGPKIDALPDGDAQKTAYLKQHDDLAALLGRNGTLTNDNELLGGVLGSEWQGDW